jgi:S-adenosylmethionine:tRNA ribosyltransferase-isomerase
VDDSEFWTGPLEYRLPSELIAQRPSATRTGSRLLILDRASGEIRHGLFPEVVDHLAAGDVLVANDSRVFPARLAAVKPSGGRVELLVLDCSVNPAPAMYKSSKPLRADATLRLSDGTETRIEGRPEAGRCFVRFPDSPHEILERLGTVPLPPYIERESSGGDAEDRERYQTVYAKDAGSVAAPTAGLHFDEPTLKRIRAKDVAFETVTLNVGPGTFTPIREKPEDHKMESEWCCVSEATAQRLNRAKVEGGRIVAVGTTSVRTLETAAAVGRLTAFAGPTDKFIRPGYGFHAIDGLLTNFHLPNSTLLCLVMALAGEEAIRRAYREAVERQYRFYSFGDAMLIL